MAERDQLRADLESTIAARRELGADLEPQLVESFLDRVEQRLEERQRERAPAPPRDRGQELGLAIVSLALAIPLIALVREEGVPAIALVCLALVLVNVVFRRA